MIDITLPDEAATLEFGQTLAARLPDSLLMFLLGDLGAGKTTLVRGLLRALGEKGPIKSPTYTLVESYLVANKRVHHFDLYRLADPEELEYTGFRDYLDGSSVCLIEWPERGGGVLPGADVTIALKVAGPGRCMTLEGHSDPGKKLARELLGLYGQKV